jgi:hypothetical protein
MVMACAAAGGPGPFDAGPSDAGPSDAAPAPADVPVERQAAPTAPFAGFWLERATTRSARQAACFKIPPAKEESVPPALIEAVAAGRLQFDAARARDCLSALGSLSCAELLAGLDGEPAGCAGVLEGLVPEGDRCGVDEECRDPQHLACVEATSGSCGRSCAARIALGGDCSGGRCLPGSSCRLFNDEGAPPRFQCATLPLEGQPCTELCAPGLFCSREAYDGFEGIDEGVCRARIAGGSCKNDWQCPLPLFCLREGGAAAGRCEPPRAGLGETCAPGQNECVPGTSCAALANGFACQVLPGLGGACGYLEASPGKSETVGCASGSCDLARGLRRGVCVERPGPGAPSGATASAPCDFWNRCGDGLRCQEGVCAPAACADPGGERGVVSGRRSPVAFRLALVHGPASRQATPLGRRLGALEPWQGRLYLGYGDYDANTGPISISFFDPASKTITEELSFDTEAIALFRPLGDKLYAPATDPRGAAVDYAVGPPWSPVAAFAATHVFDMAVVGADLFAVGSQDRDAVAWRSGDGGVQWTESVRESGAAGVFFLRYYFAAVLGGKLYVQAAPSESGQSRVLDGDAWSPGPNLLPRGGQGWNPRLFAGALIYLSWQPIGPDGGTLMRFDGRDARAVLADEVLDFAVGADAVYILTSAGRVRRSSDLAHWWNLGVAPIGARSVALLGGRVYLGGTDGRLFMIEDAP